MQVFVCKSKVTDDISIAFAKNKKKLKKQLKRYYTNDLLKLKIKKAKLGSNFKPDAAKFAIFHYPEAGGLMRYLPIKNIPPRKTTPTV